MCVVGGRRSYAKVNMIAGRGSGVFHICVVGGRLCFATCMGNSSRGEVNVGGLGSGCLGIAECCFEAVGYFLGMVFLLYGCYAPTIKESFFCG